MNLLVLCVCECLVKQFAICLGVVVIFLLNVMEVFSVTITNGNRRSLI